MKVLVADDSATVREVLASALRRWDLEPVLASDGEVAWRLLSEPDAPPLALVDWEMPALDGLALCRRIREREQDGSHYTYLLLLTARGSAHLVSGMEAGADDYLVKPFDQNELRVRLRAARRIVELQATLYRLHDELLTQSRTDPLTGCLNRRAILERFTAEAARARRDRQPLSVGMLDLDHFKRVNDEHGHPAGDRVLCELVRRLGAAVRASDVFGRMGGEEFLVLWPNAADAQLTAERVRRGVAGAPFAIRDGALALTVSLGVTTTGGDEALEAVLARADEALYRAKAGGRDRVEVTPCPGDLLAAAGS